MSILSAETKKDKRKRKSLERNDYLYQEVKYLVNTFKIRFAKYVKNKLSTVSNPIPITSVILSATIKYNVQPYLLDRLKDVSYGNSLFSFIECQESLYFRFEEKDNQEYILKGFDSEEQRKEILQSKYNAKYFSEISLIRHKRILILQVSIRNVNNGATIYSKSFEIKSSAPHNGRVGAMNITQEFNNNILSDIKLSFSGGYRFLGVGNAGGIFVLAFGLPGSGGGGALPRFSFDFGIFNEFNISELFRFHIRQVNFLMGIEAIVRFRLLDNGSLGFAPGFYLAGTFKFEIGTRSYITFIVQSENITALNDRHFSLRLGYYF